MRQLLGILAGLLIGFAGATLYRMSLPPEEGSLEATIEEKEIALKKAEREIAVLQVKAGELSDPRDTVRDRTREIARKIRNGEEVDLNDVFDATKPLTRDLAPLLSKMQAMEQKQRFESMAGRYAREYSLTEGQEESLEKFLIEKAERDAKRYTKLMTSETSRLSDIAEFGRDMQEDRSLDEFMEGALTGEERERFQEERLLERVERVQNEADRKVERLDGIVDLDEEQKDQVFLLMARGSRHFDPAMAFEGLTAGTEGLTAGQDREEAIRAVLRPEQTQAFDARQNELREKAEADLRRIGLKLPDDWDAFDETAW